MPISNQLGSVSSLASDPGALAKAAVEYLTGSEMTRVRYTFASEADPSAQWLVSHVQIDEQLGSSYRAEVHLVSQEGEDADALLGKGCTVTIEREDSRRELHGIVCRVSSGALNKTGTAVDLTIVPALQALAQRTDSRIFQNKSVPEVLEAVLGPALEPYKRKFDKRLRRDSYLTREYIVQYRESDLSFVERLMSEEGIWYFFEHPDGSDADKVELLVLVDSNDDAQTAKLGERGDELPMQLEAGTKAHWQAVTHFQTHTELAPTSVSVREYNWTNPSVLEQRAAPSEDVGDRPLYEPFGLGLAGYADKRFSEFDTDDQARIRWEREQTQALRAVGRGNVIGLIPGQKVTVSGQSAALNGDWIVLSVMAQGRDSKNQEQSLDDLEDYANTFVCARADLPYRSARVARPRVYGVQTGTVVGPTGKIEAKPGEDDIHTDEYGRIQVKLSWDRTAPGAPDATVTCFLRVAQGWGGAGWGFVFIPRIGMEVIVSFIDGDPDRPLVTGCVYNGLNAPQYELPANKTKSYIRTQSTPSGKGYNELQFDDADGKEQIFLHAQKDLNEVVEHNQSTTVKAAETLSVGATRSKTVGADETAVIKKTRTHTVHGDEKLSVVDGSSRTVEVTGDETKTITKTRTLTVNDGQDTENFNSGRVVNVKKSEALNVVDANKNDDIGGQYNVKVKDQFSVKQASNDELTIDKSFYLNSDGDIQLKNKGFHVWAKPDGTTTIEVESSLEITVGGASIKLTKDGSVTITAKQSTITATPQSLELKSMSTQVNGTQMVAITGAMVNINS